MKPLVKIMYKDQQAADASDLGLHLLVSRCVLERLGWKEERWYELRRHLIGQAKKGDAKLLAACQNANEARNFRHVFAVFDDDEVRTIKPLALSPNACKVQVRAAILATSPYRNDLGVVLLGQNMESVVAAVQRCKCAAVPEKKLKLPERDAVLASIAWREEDAPRRACVLQAVPSLEYLVARLAKIIGAGVAA
ncbi:MAG: hypothetical protein H0T76_26960 [Nannocystis sp.]|nr:hypothetical protein [Nannocystis sp.]MBA3550135.1 hypothetical protein [Nannocystis sp.]